MSININSYVNYINSKRRKY